MLARKVLCPNEFLDDYSHKAYAINEDEHFYFVIDALTFEWSRFLDHEFLPEIEPSEYIKPYYKPIENNFRDVIDGEEWIFDFLIQSKNEFLLACYFFERFLYERKQRKDSVYGAYTTALEKAKNNMENQESNPNYKTTYTYNKEVFDLFSKRVFDFLVSKFGISFIFESKKPL